jgi:hypothetical protein
MTADYDSRNSIGDNFDGPAVVGRPRHTRRKRWPTGKFDPDPRALRKKPMIEIDDLLEGRF